MKFAEAGDIPTLFTVDRWVDAAASVGVAALHLPDPDMMPGDRLNRPNLGRALYEWGGRLASVLAPRLAAVSPDLVVCDVLSPGGGMAAELHDVPWAQLSPHPLYEQSRGLPPIGSGLAAGVGAAGRLRDTVHRSMAAPWRRLGERQRARARRSIGLGARDPGPVARLIATIPALEVPRPDWPDNAFVVGPLMWEPTRRTLSTPPGDAPLVMIVPSTASIGVAGLAEMTLAALRGAGVRAVVSTLGPTPAGLPGWARAGLGLLDELLRQASVVVCGGGHGMLTKALLAGVPAVVAPGGGDQWELANRAARQGSAVIVRPPTPDTLRAAVTRVLRDPRFAAAAAAASTAAAVHDPVHVCRAALATSVSKATDLHPGAELDVGRNR